MIIDGPFGVVSAAELIGIVLFSVFIIWIISAYTVRSFESVAKLPTFKEKRYNFMASNMLDLLCLLLKDFSSLSSFS